MPSLRLVAAAPLLIATCASPCAEYPPELAILNRVGAPLDADLEDRTLAEALAHGEGSAFVDIEEGGQSGELIIRQGDDTLQLSLSSLVPYAHDAGCYVIIVEPCLEAPQEMCATAVETHWDSHQVSCWHARQVREADTDSGTDAGSAGTGTDAGAGSTQGAPNSGGSSSSG